MKLFQNLCYLAHIYADIYYKVVYYFDNDEYIQFLFRITLLFMQFVQYIIVAY